MSNPTFWLIGLACLVGLLFLIQLTADTMTYYAEQRTLCRREKMRRRRFAKNKKKGA